MVGPGTEMEPRVPQNLIRVGNTEALGMERERPTLPRVVNETKRF